MGLWTPLVLLLRLSLVSHGGTGVVIFIFVPWFCSLYCLACVIFLIDAAWVFRS